MSTYSDLQKHELSLPGIRHISTDRPLRWLHAGLQDLKSNPLPSLAYGLLFALGGDLIIISVLEHPHLVSVAISGFFLVAPLLAAGLYELSRSHARGERLMFIDSLRCFRHNSQSLAFFGLILALGMLFWERVSAVTFALIAIDTPAMASASLSDILLSGEHLAFTLIWVAAGGLLAFLIFALSIVTVPMILDHETDVATAMLTSLRAFGQNIAPLLIWAALIVGLTLFGFATLLFGLVVIMPILGHASWHAYCELVE